MKLIRGTNEILLSMILRTQNYSRKNMIYLLDHLRERETIPKQYLHQI